MDFVFPNEVNVTWTVMIVLYPYITGLVAGAFIVSSLYHVFNRLELKPEMGTHPKCYYTGLAREVI